MTCLRARGSLTDKLNHAHMSTERTQPAVAERPVGGKFPPELRTGQNHRGLGSLCRACAEYGLGGHLVSREERVDNLMTCSDLFIISATTGPASSVCPDSTLSMAPATLTGPAPVTVGPNIPCTSSVMLGSLPMAFWEARVTERVEASRRANLAIDETPYRRSGDNLLLSVPNTAAGSLARALAPPRRGFSLPVGPPDVPLRNRSPCDA